MPAAVTPLSGGQHQRQSLLPVRRERKSPLRRRGVWPCCGPGWQR
ncbi:hypothetical protein [Kamptonema formosum]|nr:hypothetical protein [Oscillatoria sp. PCC 10802]